MTSNAVLGSGQGDGGDGPLVSIVVTCFNYDEYVAEALNSARDQTWGRLEIVVVDDGSTDSSASIIDDFKSRAHGREVKVIHQANSGQPAAARNAGIEIAKGELILPLDADDRLAPTMVEECVNEYLDNPDAEIIYTDVQEFGDSDERITAREYDLELLKYQNHLSYCSLYPRRGWQEVGGYRLNIRGCEDWDMWLALGLRGYRGKHLGRPLFHYRRHGRGVFQDVLKEFAAKGARVALNNRGGFHPLELVPLIRNLNGQVDGQETSSIDDAPLVSVIVPTRNRKKLLGRALSSLLGQLYPLIEVVVINDDGERVDDVVKRSKPGCKITVIHLNEQVGPGAARNIGLRHASGEYIAYLDDDDELLPGHLTSLVGRLQRCPELTGVYGACARVDDSSESKRELGGDQDQEADDGRSAPGSAEKSVSVMHQVDFNRGRLLVYNHIPNLAFVHRREVLERTSYFDEDFEVLEDWDFMIRQALVGELAYVPVVVALIHHDANRAHRNQRQGLWIKTHRQIYERYAAYTAPENKTLQNDHLQALSNDLAKASR